YMLRNCIAHHGGDIKVYIKPKKLQKFAEEEGIVSDAYYTGPILELSDEYCRKIKDSLYSFFTELNHAYYELKKQR
ncbi:hypothetical protein ACFLXE_05610, partial [Chloroflexota bacterium]